MWFRVGKSEFSERQNNLMTDSWNSATATSTEWPAYKKRYHRHFPYDSPAEEHEYAILVPFSERKGLHINAYNTVTLNLIWCTCRGARPSFTTFHWWHNYYNNIKSASTFVYGLLIISLAKKTKEIIAIKTALWQFSKKKLLCVSYVLFKIRAAPYLLRHA